MAVDTVPEATVAAGQLVPLRTKDEVRASLETQTVYIVEIPARFANAVKECVKKPHNAGARWTSCADGTQRDPGCRP